MLTRWCNGCAFKPMYGNPPSVPLNSVLAGRVVPFGRPGSVSAIDKIATSERVTINTFGILQDEQGDPKHHGGLEKALHHYPFDHYPYWRSALAPDVPFCLERPGAFGENISTVGWTEKTMCVGDLCRVGSVLLQISQARQPCWKLDHRFETKGMARKVQRSGLTGWYYRVLEGGTMRTSERLELVDRLEPDWPLAKLLHLMSDRSSDRVLLKEAAALKCLSESWRNIALKRATTGKTNDSTARLDGCPPP